LGFQFIPSPANLASLMFDACAAFGFFRQLLGQTLELLLHFRPRPTATAVSVFPA